MAARNVQLEQRLQSAEEEIARLKDENQDLLSICKKEDVQRMKVDLLFTACESGDVSTASRLLAALPEANLNTIIQWSADGMGELTLLTHAAGQGHAEICQMLLDKGAEVNQRSEGNYYLSSERTSPLINACRYGHF